MRLDTYEHTKEDLVTVLKQILFFFLVGLGLVLAKLGGLI